MLTDSALTDENLTHEERAERLAEDAKAHLKASEYQYAGVCAQLSTTYAILATLAVMATSPQIGYSGVPR